MLLLVLDTSTPAVTAGVVELGAGGSQNLLSERVTVDARRHGELLAPSVETVLTEAGVTPSDLGAVVAGLGPGPFTGLRVGLVTAAVFGHALAVPTYGVCSLDAIAYPAHPGQRLLVATDARRREVYWATYQPDGTRDAGPAVSRPADVDATGCLLARGAGAAMYADVLGLPLGEPAYPPAAGLAALAAQRALDAAPSERLTPLYLRRPDAALPTAAKTVLR